MRLSSPFLPCFLSFFLSCPSFPCLPFLFLSFPFLASFPSFLPFLSFAVLPVFPVLPFFLLLPSLFHSLSFPFLRFPFLSFLALFLGSLVSNPTCGNQNYFWHCSVPEVILVPTCWCCRLAVLRPPPAHAPETGFFERSSSEAANAEKGRSRSSLAVLTEFVWKRLSENSRKSRFSPLG